MGNSLGAAALGDVMSKALALLPADTHPVVIRQADAKRIDTLRASYAAAGINDAHTQLAPSADDMTATYAHADLVVCHAGAMIVSKVAAAGVTTLFTPLPHAVSDHQTVDVHLLSEHDAALSVPQ